MTFSPTLVIPQILVDNKARYSSATLNYDGATANPSFPLVNAFDWKDWTLFQVQTGTTDIRITLTADQTSNAFAWFVKKLAATDTGFSIRAFWESSPGVYSPLGPAIDPLASPIGMQVFADQVIPAGRSLLIRFVVPAGKVLYLRQAAIGQRIEPETGQNVGVSPPILQQSWKTTNALSVNGSLIGRNIIRLVKDYEINLEYLSPSFIQNVWAPFCTHALRYPFFFRWNPSSYPDDCLFASAKTVETPTVSKPGRLSAKMPLVGITE